MQTKYFLWIWSDTTPYSKCLPYGFHHNNIAGKPQRVIIHTNNSLCHPLPHLTQRNLLQEVQVAAKEFLPQSIVQVERHTVLAHLIIRLRPAVSESLMRPAKLHNGGGIRHSESSAKWLKACVIMQSSRCLWKKFWRHHGAAICRRPLVTDWLSVLFSAECLQLPHLIRSPALGLGWWNEKGMGKIASEEGWCLLLQFQKKLLLLRSIDTSRMAN